MASGPWSALSQTIVRSSESTAGQTFGELKKLEPVHARASIRLLRPPRAPSPRFGMCVLCARVNFIARNEGKEFPRIPLAASPRALARHTHRSAVMNRRAQTHVCGMRVRCTLGEGKGWDAGFEPTTAALRPLRSENVTTLSRRQIPRPMGVGRENGVPGRNKSSNEG